MCTLGEAFEQALFYFDVIAAGKPEGHMRWLLSILKKQLPLRLAHVAVVVLFWIQNDGENSHA